MCMFSRLVTKSFVLVALTIITILCLLEIAVTIVKLFGKKDTDGLLYMLLVANLLYLIALAVGFYGSVVSNLVCLRVVLFVIAGYLLIKIFISAICSITREHDKELIINYWFHSNFVGSVVCFIIVFLYFLRLKEMIDGDDY